MKLNKGKTKVLNIDVKVKRSNPKCFPVLSNDGVIIDTVETFSYLGISIDHSLKMDVHLNNCIRRAYSKIYMLIKLRVYMDKSAALSLYKSMVLPYIEYGNSFLLGSNTASKIKLQRIQNRGLKIALKRERRYSTDILHKEARLATWEVRARMALTRLMFKYKHQDEYIECDIGRSTTRLQSGPFFKLATPKTDKFKNSVSYLGRAEWNKLPAYIRCIDDYVKFKKEVKSLFNHRYFSGIIDVSG